MRRLIQVSVILSLASGFNIFAQGRLLAFTGKDTNAPDVFAFVALNDISMGTEIFFTNYDFDNVTGTFGTVGTEGTIRFTATALIPRGSVIRVTQDTPSTAGPYTVDGSGTAVHVAGEPVWAAVSADPHYAFAASNSSAPLTSVTEVYAYLDTDPDDASGTAKNPTTGAVPSPNVVILDFVGVQPVGVDFPDASRATATLAQLTNPANFTQGASLTPSITPFTDQPGLPVELVEFQVD